MLAKSRQGQFLPERLSAVYAVHPANYTPTLMPLCGDLGVRRRGDRQDCVSRT